MTAGFQMAIMPFMHLMESLAKSILMLIAGNMLPLSLKASAIMMTGMQGLVRAGKGKLA